MHLKFVDMNNIGTLNIVFKKICNQNVQRNVNYAVKILRKFSGNNSLCLLILVQKFLAKTKLNFRENA
jgi:hypothetical protein